MTKITDAQQIETFYQALLAKDQHYVGIFYAGVTTTSIFCIATCRARKPKFEHVEFFSTFKAALQAGYRPCKICRPTENAAEAPQEVRRAIELIRQNPKQKISDSILSAQQISPETIRRWFKKHYGITFQTFQRMYRINQAYQELKSGKNVVNTAYDSGYESLSGFSYMYKQILNNSPSQHTHKDIMLINRLTTPIGPMFICATAKGVCLLEFVDRRMLETELAICKIVSRCQLFLEKMSIFVRPKENCKNIFKEPDTILPSNCIPLVQNFNKQSGRV